jgi:SLT domain-containing protein
MNETEIDLATTDIIDSVKTFLSYCPDGSVNTAIQNAMTYVKSRYGNIDNVSYRRLNIVACQAYNDITKSTDAKIQRKTSHNLTQNANTKQRAR